MSNMWKKILIILSGYVNFIAFAVVGGLVCFKSEDEELKKTAKLTLIISLIFLGLLAIFAIYNYIGGMVDGYISSAAYDVYVIINKIILIAEIIVYAVLIIMELVKGLSKKEENN